MGRFGPPHRLPPLRCRFPDNDTRPLAEQQAPADLARSVLKAVGVSKESQLQTLFLSADFNWSGLDAQSSDDKVEEGCSNIAGPLGALWRTFYRTYGAAQAAMAPSGASGPWSRVTIAEHRPVLRGFLLFLGHRVTFWQLLFAVVDWCLTASAAHPERPSAKPPVVKVPAGVQPSDDDLRAVMAELAVGRICTSYIVEYFFRIDDDLLELLNSNVMLQGEALRQTHSETAARAFLRDTADVCSAVRRETSKLKVEYGRVMRKMERVVDKETATLRQRRRRMAGAVNRVGRIVQLKAVQDAATCGGSCLSRPIVLRRLLYLTLLALTFLLIVVVLVVLASPT